MKWKNNRVLTDAVLNFIENKVHSLFPNAGIRRKAMQVLFFHSLALQNIFIDLFLCRPASASCYLHCVCESVGGAKHAAM